MEYKSLADLYDAFNKGEINPYELLNAAFDVGKSFHLRDKSGTITWFKCDNSKPPIDNGHSVPILLLLASEHYLPNFNIGKGRYFESDIGRFVPFNGNWLPTHWAYLNLPEQP